MKIKTNKNMAKWNLPNKLSGITKTNLAVLQQGFTLIELLVATAIGIIVLLAASSTFITTYKLNQEVKVRTSYEQDVRNAADLLRTDARQLGNFGCLKAPSTSELNSLFAGAFAQDANKQFVSTTSLTNEKTLLGVTRNTGIDPLLITYINGKYAEGIIGTDCNSSMKGELKNDVNASAYIVGTTQYNKISGLYKVNYENGQWSAPQLVISNVTNMNTSFSYDGHNDSDCPQSTSSGSLDPSINDSANLDTNYPRPPILIKATLTICPSGQYDDNNNCKENNTTDYFIQAMVRRGEVCQ